MDRSLFSNASYLPRGLFALATLALIFNILFHSQFTSSAVGQDLIKETAELVSSESPATTESASPSSAAILVDLAASVGETAAAKRLFDYIVTTDPTSRQRYYAVVDFSQPSTSKRLYVFDTVGKTVERYYVAHGRGSGEDIAERFSNINGSNSSSLGIYKTLDEYNGHHGRSLRLEGLEASNSNVLSRGVVMHTADYVSESFIRQTGRLGRSEGCFAVEKAVGDTLINELKNGAYIIATKN